MSHLFSSTLSSIPLFGRSTAMARTRTPTYVHGVYTHSSVIVLLSPVAAMLLWAMGAFCLNYKDGSGNNNDSSNNNRFMANAQDSFSSIRAFNSRR